MSLETWELELEERAATVPQTEVEATDGRTDDGLYECIGCGGRPDMCLIRSSACGCHDEAMYAICESCKDTPLSEERIEKRMEQENIRRVGRAARNEYIRKNSGG